MKNQHSVLKSLVVLAGLALLPMTTQAQEIHNRHVDQHTRIHQGVESGQLTHRETRNLHARESHIRYRTRRDRMMHGGHLTRAERARLNRAQNRTSHAIYRDKHNGAVR